MNTNNDFSIGSAIIRNPKGLEDAVSAPTQRDTPRIDVEQTANGFSASVDGKTIMQFENPLEPYWFSSAETAERAAKQFKQSGPGLFSLKP